MATEIKPKYTIIDYKGQKARQYQDGAIRDNGGRLLKVHPKAEEHAITTENASALQRLRQDKYKQAAADAVQNEIGAKEPGIHTPFAAWGVLNGRLAVQIMNSDKPRGKDLEILGRNMGALGSQDGDNVGISSQDNSDRELLLAIARAAGQQIAKAIVHDVDNYTYLNHESDSHSIDDSVIDASVDVDAESDEK